MCLSTVCPNAQQQDILEKMPGFMSVYNILVVKHRKECKTWKERRHYE
jgi:hypothetical protein